MKSLTRDEVKRLLVCVDDKRDRLLIQLGLVIGCRVSEIVSIELRNVHSDRIKIHDRKKNIDRDVVIDSETRGLLEDYLAHDWKAKPHKRHQLFYFSTKTANRIMQSYCEKAGIPKEKAHWHALRHTYIIQSLETGIPINHIVEQTGDSPTTVIRVYGRPSIDSRLSLIEQKGRYWEEKALS